MPVSLRRDILKASAGLAATMLPFSSSAQMVRTHIGREPFKLMGREFFYPRRNDPASLDETIASLRQYFETHPNFMHSPMHAHNVTNHLIRIGEIMHIKVEDLCARIGLNADQIEALERNHYKHILIPAHNQVTIAKTTDNLHLIVNALGIVSTSPKCF